MGVYCGGERDADCAGAEGEKKDDDKGKKKDGEKPEEHKSDVRIITKAVYRSNGTGYIDTKDASQLYVFDMTKLSGKTVTPWQMTAGRFAVSDVVWHPSSNAIYYTSEHTDEPYYDLPHNEIYAVAVPAAGAAKEEKAPVPQSVLVIKLKTSASGMAISPDGKRIAFHSEEEQPDAEVASAAGYVCAEHRSRSDGGSWCAEESDGEV